MPALGIQYTGRAGFIYQPGKAPDLGPVEIGCRTVTTATQGDNINLLVAVPANRGIDGASERIIVDSLPRREHDAVIRLEIRVVWVAKEAWYPTAQVLAVPPTIRLQFSAEPNLTQEQIASICYLHPNINEAVSRKRLHDMKTIRGKRPRYGSN